MAIALQVYGGTIPSSIATGDVAYVSNGNIAGNAEFTTDGAGTVTIGNSTSENCARIAKASSGNSAAITAVGVDSVTGIDIVGKGSNSDIRLMSGTAVSLGAFSDSSAVNYIQINGADTGIAPQIIANGTDTNIALVVNGKGSSSVNFGCSGVNFAVLESDVAPASTVNIFTIHASGTGVPPYLAAFSGTDTDVNIGFKGQGKGGFGYLVGFGQGGTVSQLTSRQTGVTLNKIAGQITLFSTTPPVTPATFTVTNNCVNAVDAVIALVSASSTNNVYTAAVSRIVDATSFDITVTSVSGTTTDAPVINFTIIKSSAS